MTEIKNNKLIFCDNCLSKVDNTTWNCIERIDDTKLKATFTCKECFHSFDVNLKNSDFKINFDEIFERILKQIINYVTEYSTTKTELYFNFVNSKIEDYDIYEFFSADTVSHFNFYLNFYNSYDNRKNFAIDLKNTLESIGLNVDLKFAKNTYPPALYNFYIKVEWRDLYE